jgi:NADH dehydrogenase
MAGAIAELAHRALAADFRTIDPTSARIVLVEAADRLLTAFHPSLSEAAKRSLEALGVEVRLGSPVERCDARGVTVAGERIDSRTIIWGAGVMASPAGRWLGAEVDRAGRVEVGADLSVPGHPNIFAIGDTAVSPGPDGRPLPGIAPVAKQQGQYLARLLVARAAGRSVGPFRYRDFGILATIGRSHAVAQFGRFRISGFFAWLLWSFAHIYFLIGFRNRLSVALNWAWNYLTFQRGTRLITGLSGLRPTPPPPIADVYEDRRETAFSLPSAAPDTAPRPLASEGAGHEHDDGTTARDRV